jgi:NADPH-dependent glutamate synthase beta subunit-like oxidoreductase
MSQAIVFKNLKEMPPMAVSLADMSFNQTGSWRYLRPAYEEKLPPCRRACPAGTDWPRALALLADEKTVEAWQMIRQANPLPGICGRVCYHPCETACNRGKFDEAVSIQALERFTADSSFDLTPETPQIEKRRGRVAIVGSGPAGLSAAYFLARTGYRVTIFEAESDPGGMLRLGIPSYRLPREVLNREIELIAALDVDFQLNTQIGSDLDLEKFWQRHDAVFIATGAHCSRSLEIPGEDETGVRTGLGFLKAVNGGRRVKLGPRVAVIGGGNTAIDAARTALRLGARPTIIYRRTRAEMPAIADEIEEAEHEGIEFVFLAAPRGLHRVNGKLEIQLIRMKLGELDASGRRRPVPIEGSEFTLQADSVLKAAGEEPDLSFCADCLETSSGIVMNNPQGLLKRAGIFLGGDARSGPSTVIQAIASGKDAARAIQGYLEQGPKPPMTKLDEALFERLNLAYFGLQPRAQVASLSVAERISDFSEIKEPLSSDQALAEAMRCFSCGVCNFCDNCRVFCPDVAVSRANGSYEINLDYCKGCGICAEECPRAVISLREEER